MPRHSANCCTACGTRWAIASAPEPEPTPLVATCPRCKGAKYLDPKEEQKCPRCKGHGVLVVRTQKEAARG